MDNKIKLDKNLKSKDIYKAATIFAKAIYFLLKDQHGIFIEHESERFILLKDGEEVHVFYADKAIDFQHGLIVPITKNILLNTLH